MNDRCCVILSGHGKSTLSTLINMKASEYQLLFLTRINQALNIPFFNLILKVMWKEGPAQVRKLLDLNDRSTCKISKFSPWPDQIRCLLSEVRESCMTYEHYLGAAPPLETPELFYLDQIDNINYQVLYIRGEAAQGGRDHREWDGMGVCFNYRRLVDLFNTRTAIINGVTTFPTHITLEATDFMQIFVCQKNKLMPLSYMLETLPNLRLCGSRVPQGHLSINNAYMFDANNKTLTPSTMKINPLVPQNSHYVEFSLPTDTDVLWGACRSSTL